VVCEYWMTTFVGVRPAESCNLLRRAIGGEPLLTRDDLGCHDEVAARVEALERGRRGPRSD
jgi:hypothetical protein